MKKFIITNPEVIENYGAVDYPIYIIGSENMECSDGYHTFTELYEFRKVYNATLFNEWYQQGKYEIHKSKKHFDGEDCFGGGWFIVVAVLPTGQISNHYQLEDWDLFQVEETEKVKYEFDGHTSQDVVTRLLKLHLKMLLQDF